jgi:hypothetical protein
VANTSTDEQVAWIEHSKQRPTEANWYLVAVPTTKDTIATVTIAWWEPGSGYGWRDIWNFDNGEEMPRPLYWMPTPKLPPKLQKQRDKEFRRPTR